METFNLDSHPHVELCDLLKFQGWCESGGAAKEVIAEGLVKVNGKVETRKRCKIVADQVVEFNGGQVVVKP
ncbi:ribosome-associated protein YbcJ [Serratia plymuthica]|jgi:ribosome-associated protein|uniref:Ribosome-associated protein n=2 Tax=Serratia plymuthica TaxID=82996 RepID=A0A318NVI5_SERPL|nr:MULTISPECIES: ribosome-associated protein YbcJ [Serratia]AGO53995.1 YbcJ [Serratia plymuthica 4Rx13]AGP43357.1 RNA-binding protein [Serratia plymuthica S13]ANJ92472.1 ribosome-associated protein [Serratia plymuthica]ANJ97466.1 ribosome-associated protein [Serratia plymuthica]EKF65756.1 S4 RNA-binding domain protein [Serratia plymuthica A30]